MNYPNANSMIDSRLQEAEAKPKVFKTEADAKRFVKDMIPDGIAGDISIADTSESPIPRNPLWGGNRPPRGYVIYAPGAEWELSTHVSMKNGLVIS